MAALVKFASRLLAVLGASWLVLTFTPVVNWWAQWLSSGYSDDPRPVLVVLSGDRLNEETIGYSTYLRCVYAARFWHRNHTETIILTGGPAQHPIAPLMANLMVTLGVPREALLLEPQAEDTRDNLAKTAQMLRRNPRPATLLTSDFHMRRALLLAARNGLAVVPHPVPDVLKRADANRWEKPGLAVLLGAETAKLAWESIR